MPVALKIALLFGGTWLGSLVLSLISTGIAAGVTSRWSAQRVGGVMLLIMALDVVFAIAGSFVLWRGLATNLPATGPRVVLLLGHAALQLATVAVVILMTFVGFNR
jgi:hypothetical protein